MNLLHIEAPGRAVWREAPMPEPGAGEVLVKIIGVTTCPHWDLHLMDGIPMFPDRPLTYPYTPGEPGHEAMGEIVALGDGVADFTVGMKVAAWRDPGGRRQGCYAEYAALEAAHLLPIPDTLAPAQIAALELAMCVQGSLNQLREIGGVQDRHVAVAGLGPAGLIAVQMARAYGAARITAIDPLPQRRALALNGGADEAVAPDAASLPQHRTAPEAFYTALDTTGLKVSIEALMQRTRRAVAIFGVLRETVDFGPAHWWGGFSLMGYGTHTREQAEQALDLILAGRLDLTPLVTHHLPLTAYAEGVALLRRKEAVKVLFYPG